jgi:hypothetical protein
MLLCGYCEIVNVFGTPLCAVLSLACLGLCTLPHRTVYYIHVSFAPVLVFCRYGGFVYGNFPNG